MEISIRIEATISIQDGETNINEVLWTMGNWSREVGLKVIQGVVETYQGRIVELLCAGQGQASWVAHERKGTKGQMCVGGSYGRGGKREHRVLRTEFSEAADSDSTDRVPEVWETVSSAGAAVEDSAAFQADDLLAVHDSGDDDGLELPQGKCADGWIGANCGS